MSSNRPSPSVHRFLVHALLLAVFFLIALFLRSYGLIDPCFRSGSVIFRENDPWYHVRAIEHLIENFPHRLSWDPFALHPGGQYVAIGPLFDWMAASFAIILGAGKTNLALTHAVCAWLPAVWGALTVVPTYFMGAILRNARAGLLAAATLAVLPGQFLLRSTLGYADHHVAESFFSLLAVLFLMGFLRRCSSRETTSGSTTAASELEARLGRGPQAILCGLSMGCYLLAWVGGSLLVLTLLVALTIHLMVEYTRGRAISRACIWIVAAWMVALLMVVPFHRVPGFRYHIVALTGSALYVLAAAGVAWAIKRSRGPRALFPVGLFCLAIVGMILFRWAAAGVFAEVARSVVRFVSGKAGTFIMEARPLLYDDDAFTLLPAIEMFQASAVTAALGAILLVYRICRDAAPGGVIFAAWTIGVVLATLTQERFTYYLAVNVAVLSGFFWGAMLDALARRLAESELPRRRVWTAMSHVLFLTIGLYPSASAAFFAAHEPIGPHPDWLEAMSWLRQNSPEPFDEPGFFDQSYDRFAADAGVPRPKAKYSVMCSWDHGYWVTEMAQRVPTANPTQSGLNTAAAFFAAQNEEDAAEILLRLDARYVVVDETLPVWPSALTNRFEGSFGTIARLAGHDEYELYEPHIAPNEDGTFKPVILYYPEYYRSMLNRLYLFGAQVYVPEWSTWVVRTSTVSTVAGDRVKRINAGLQFRTYDLAHKFVEEHGGEGWRIVGMSPTESCVPLEPLRGFRRVYQSPTQAVLPNARGMSAVEIFEFTPSKD